MILFRTAREALISVYPGSEVPERSKSEKAGKEKGRSLVLRTAILALGPLIQANFRLGLQQFNEYHAYEYSQMNKSINKVLADL